MRSRPVRFPRFTLFLASLAVLAACHDSATSPQDPYVTAMVNGQTWSANYTTSVAIGDQWPTARGTMMQVVGLQTGADGSSQQVTVEFLYTGPGSYALGTAQAYAYYVYCPSFGVHACTDYMATTAGSGTLNVAMVDTTTHSFSGSFSFQAPFDAASSTMPLAANGPTVVTVANGKFDGHYSVD